MPGDLGPAIEDDHLIAIIQPDESGVDASPKFDPLMRYPKDNRDLVAWIDTSAHSCAAAVTSAPACTPVQGSIPSHVRA